MAQLNGELDGAAMFLAVAQFNRAACACDLRSRMDPETVPGGTIRKNPAKPIRVRNWQVHRYKPDWGRFAPQGQPDGCAPTISLNTRRIASIVAATEQ
jgi:hypothetical protein